MEKDLLKKNLLIQTSTIQTMML